MSTNDFHHGYRYYSPTVLPPHIVTARQPPLRPAISHSSPASFPILAVAVIGIIATAFLLICYYIFAIKCCLNWQRFRYLNRFAGARGRRQEDPLIVYATAPQSRGLDASVIRAIPIFQLKREAEGKEKAFNECAVCLSEFQEDERLRLLPNCNHAFHIDCIDTWLQGNANCPLCRSRISNSRPFDRNIGPFRPQDPDQSSSNLGGDIVIEIGDAGLDEAARSLGLCPGSSLAVSIPTQRQPSPKKSEPRVLCKKQRRFDHVSSMGDECIDVRRKVDEFCVQPIRRSFSMDSSADRQLYLSVQEVLRQNPQFHEASGSCEGSSSSCKFRRSFFSFGHSRGSKNAILPVQDEA